VGVSSSRATPSLVTCTNKYSCITFIFLLGTLRSSIALFLVFFFLDITFWLLAAGHLTRNHTTTKAGGGLGVVTAVTAFYTALAGILTEDTSYFILPVGNLAK
jgi:succinate-acetate transporter protein